MGQPETMWQLYMDGSIVRWAYSGGDEFDGNSLDQYKWRNDYPWGRNYSGTCAQEYMTDGLNYSFSYNSDIQSNTIKLIAKKEDVFKKGIEYEDDDYLLLDGQPNLRWWHYTSGMLFSKQKYKYGIFEIRFKLPAGKGFFPAFWLFGGNPNEEFDIFEYKGEMPNKVHYDMHCPNCSSSFGDWVTANGNFSDGFNDMMGEWNPEWSQWVLNGQNFQVWFGNLNYQANIIANFSIAGPNPCAFSPDPDNTTIFPAEFEIDFIRVWTRLDCEQDQNICNYNQTLEDPTVLTGNQINIGGSNCQVSLQSGQSLKLIATNNITINSSFHANYGSQFHAKIVDCPDPGNVKSYVDGFSGLKVENINEIDSIKSLILKQQVNSPVLYTKIFPNPTKDKITIEFAGKVDRNIRIELFNFSGQCVYFKDNITDSKIEIDVSFLRQGVYELKGTFGNNSVSEKIIIK